MKLFFSYLRGLVRVAVLWCVSAVVFAAVFFLYSLPTEAFIYASALCFVAAAAACAAGFARFRAKHLELERLSNNVSAGIETLPDADSPLESDYAELVRTLASENRRILSEYSVAMSEASDYYALWTHQIKAPISAMHLLLDRDDTERGAELARELFRIEQYVEMALGYVRAGSMSGDLCISSRPVDPIVRAAIRKYAREFIQRRVDLDYAGTNIVTLTDEKWLSFVIEQMLSNALKYTRKGKISIYSEGCDLIIEDTGIGIMPEDLPRLFERGFTGRNGRMDMRSTGIGLYLSKKIMTRLGHTIEIQSAPEKGTRVRLGLRPPDRVSD